MSIVFTCSIDDGYPSDMRVAELLIKHDINATFFIPIKNRSGLNMLSIQQIRNLGHHFEIGSHTYDHCYLTTINIIEAQRQIYEGKNRLEDILGKKINGFCYPGGKYWQEHVDMVKSAGFAYARSVMNLRFDAGDDMFKVPTTMQFYPHDRIIYLRNFIKAGHWLKRSDGLRLALEHQHWIDRLYALFEYAYQHGDVFHLWAHSWEIDTLGIWSEFNRFLAYVAAKVAIENRLDNGQLVSRFFRP